MSLSGLVASSAQAFEEVALELGGLSDQIGQAELAEDGEHQGLIQDGLNSPQAGALLRVGSPRGKMKGSPG